MTLSPAGKPQSKKVRRASPANAEGIWGHPAMAPPFSLFTAPSHPPGGICQDTVLSPSPNQGRLLSPGGPGGLWNPRLPTPSLRVWPSGSADDRHAQAVSVERAASRESQAHLSWARKRAG